MTFKCSTNGLFNPMQSGVFEKANDPGVALKAHPPFTILKTIVSIVTILCMCILLGVLGMFLLEFYKSLQF